MGNQNSGRPKKPTALKKKQGTYRKDRDEKNSDVAIANTPMILKDVNGIECPKSLTLPEAQAYFQTMINSLLALGVLGSIDVPQVEQLCLYLQKLKEAENQFVKASVFDEDYDEIEQRYTRLVNQFDKLAQKYYVSPVARSKIRLDELTIKDKELTVAEKEKSAVSKLLANRKGAK